MTKLVVIRGNSGSGKTSIARALRSRYERGCALVEQDYLRRTVLKELDKPGGLAPALIGQTARLALDHGYHVVLEGILAAARYRPMLSELLAGHRGETYLFYLDVPLPETLRRHAMRPQAAEFTADDMRGWYRPDDRLGLDGERVVTATATLDDAVALIATAAGFPVAGAAEGLNSIPVGSNAQATPWKAEKPCGPSADSEEVWGMRLKRNGVDVGRRPRVTPADQENRPRTTEHECTVCLQRTELGADGRCATCAGTPYS